MLSAAYPRTPLRNDHRIDRRAIGVRCVYASQIKPRYGSTNIGAASSLQLIATTAQIENHTPRRTLSPRNSIRTYTANASAENAIIPLSGRGLGSWSISA